VLAEEIAGGSKASYAVVEAYRQRRQDRIRTILRRSEAIGSRHDYPIGDDEPVGTLSRLRASALGPFCTASLAELQREIPTRL
jgi:hypothetical protein